MSEQIHHIKKKIGKIISDKMTNTVVVKIERMVNHPLYTKKYRVSKNILADNPENKYKINDVVEIEETRKISKLKSWKITRKIQ